MREYAETLQKDSKFHSFPEYLQKKELIGMMQGSHLFSIDQVSPFFGTIVDVVYRNESDHEITELFTSYMNLCIFLQRDGLLPFWSAEELSSFLKNLDTSRRRAIEFSVRTRSQMGVRKSDIYLIT